MSAREIVEWTPGAACRRFMMTDAEAEALRRRVSRNMTRAITALVLATGFSVQAHRPK